MTDMTDQEKSVMMAKAMGWDVEWNKYGLGCVIDGNNNPISGTIDELDEGILSDLYESRNMALAWWVKRWMHEEDDRCMVTTFTDWYRRHAVRLSRMDDADAQRIWLDKIHELIIEGAVERQGAEHDYPVPGTHTV